MKTCYKKRFWKKSCICLYFFCLGLFSAKGQCNNTLHSLSYDTLVPGSGNDIHSFTFSQFDPSIGTLVAARINSVVSLNYGFTLQNVEAVQRDFSVSVGRYDNFTSTALSSPYTNLLTIPDGNYLLNPGSEVTQAPATILYRYINSDSITTNTAAFLGSGTVAFNYTPITYTNLTGSNVYYYSATASDTIDFSITYFYCNATVLPLTIANFQAVKQNMGQVVLSWLSLNDPGGSDYEIQESSDGENFDSAGLVISRPGDANQGDYSYDYTLQTGDPNRLYFRLKITESGGNVSYSEIREVDLTNRNPAPGLYPNPSNTYIDLVFDPTLSGNWQVDIYSTAGSLLQTNLFSRTANAHIPFRNRLAAGVYFLRAINLDTRRSFVRDFSVK